MTENDRKSMEAKLVEDLKASKMSEATKQALKERTIEKAQEFSDVRAIRGLETGNRKPKIMLANGLMVNADAFDD